jgi:beta-lactamase class C
VHLLALGSPAAWPRDASPSPKGSPSNTSPKRLIRAAILSVCLAHPGARAADDDSRYRAVVEGAIRPLMVRYEIPGMAVALTLGGQAYIFTFGVASEETKAPVSETTLFEIGSVSKTFTATLAGYAQATGKLSLGDHPSKYLPQLKGTPIDKATLLHLGTYTAGGLPLQFPDAVEGDATTMAYFRNWMPVAPPGTQRQYSNASLGLFGLVTSVALNDDFAHAVESTIFRGFGMTHSFVRIPSRAMSDYAWGYSKGKPVRMSAGPLSDETYGVRTTAPDLLRFVQGNIDPSGLEAPLRRAVEATHVGYFRAGPLVQGLGWEQFAYPVSREWLLGGNAEEIINDPQPAHAVEPKDAAGAHLFDKTGSTRGFGAYVAFAPSRRIGIVMLANKNYPIPARVDAAWSILDQLAPNP